MSDEGRREWTEHVILQASQKPTLDAHFYCSVLMAQGLHGNHFFLSLVVTSSNPSLLVKNLPATQETWVQSLGGEDPLEKGMATHFSILPGELHEQRSLVGYSPWGCKESDMTAKLTLVLHFILPSNNVCLRNKELPMEFYHESHTN